MALQTGQLIALLFTPTVDAVRLFRGPKKKQQKGHFKSK